MDPRPLTAESFNSGVACLGSEKKLPQSGAFPVAGRCECVRLIASSAGWRGAGRGCISVALTWFKVVARVVCRGPGLAPLFAGQKQVCATVGA
jgi:hypothetical protein